ncbi:hypothetical protein sortregn_28 [Escherichia phage sortregn]|nr:hypothetical protein sortregn_28 [Escherichia phage sortregn]
MSIFTFINRKLGRFKTCRTCKDKHPCGFGEWPSMFFMCDKCQNKTLEELFEPGRLNRLTMVHQTEEQMAESRRRLGPLIDSLVSQQRQSKQTAAQTQAAKAAQYRDPRSVAMARQMAHDPRPAARGTQQDPISDPMHLLNPLNPLSPVSPLNPLNDWDDSSHRHHVAPAMSEPTECHTTSHSSGYESSSSDYSSSSYDSGSDSSSYSSGGCD